MTSTHPTRIPGMLGPKRPDHSSVGLLCQACLEPLAVGDYTTLITLGPGNDPQQRERARKGRPYTAVGLEIHWGCATGEPAPQLSLSQLKVLRLFNNDRSKNSEALPIFGGDE